MDQHTATPYTQERSSVGRRTVLKGAAGVAWTVPTVVALGTTAAAATSYQFSFDSLTPPLINAATTDSLVATGKGPKGAEISLTINGTSAGKVNVGTDGIWSKTFVPAVDVPEGKDVEVKATLGTTVTKTYTKDTTAPGLTRTGATGNHQAGAITGAKGNLTAPTADAGTLTYVFSSPNLGLDGTGLTYPTSTTWRLQWIWNSTGNANGQKIKVTQTDGAGNSTTVTFTI